MGALPLTRLHFKAGGSVFDDGGEKVAFICPTRFGTGFLVSRPVRSWGWMTLFAIFSTAADARAEVLARHFGNG